MGRSAAVAEDEAEPGATAAVLPLTSRRGGICSGIGDKRVARNRRSVKGKGKESCGCHDLLNRAQLTRSGIGTRPVTISRGRQTKGTRTHRRQTTDRHCKTAKWQWHIASTPRQNSNLPVVHQRLTQVYAFLAFAYPVFFLSTILGSRFSTPSLASSFLTPLDTASASFLAL